MNREQLKTTFGWINPEDLELGSFGYLNEGWVDAKRYLLAVRNKATYLEAEYLKGELNVSFYIMLKKSKSFNSKLKNFKVSSLVLRMSTIISLWTPTNT